MRLPFQHSLDLEVSGDITATDLPQTKLRWLPPYPQVPQDVSAFGFLRKRKHMKRMGVSFVNQFARKHWKCACIIKGFTAVDSQHLTMPPEKLKWPWSVFEKNKITMTKMQKFQDVRLEPAQGQISSQTVDTYMGLFCKHLFFTDKQFPSFISKFVAFNNDLQTWNVHLLKKPLCLLAMFFIQMQMQWLKPQKCYESPTRQGSRQGGDIQKCDSACPLYMGLKEKWLRWE